MRKEREVLFDLFTLVLLHVLQTILLAMSSKCFMEETWEESFFASNLESLLTLRASCT